MTVHVLATGGTISSHFDGTEWVNVDGPSLVAELGELPVEVDVVDIAAGPSSSLSTDDMVAIARRVEQSIVAGAEGVVVVHGTDTVELTGFMTQLILGSGPGRPPVVFTGSMRPHSHPHPDGPANLRRAIAIAADRTARGRDVMVCFGHEVHAADRVRKHSAVSVDAFHSAPFGPMAVVADGRPSFDMETSSRRSAAGVAGPVPLLTCYPGMPNRAVEDAAAGAAGLVIEGFGDLNVPTSLWDPLLAAHGAGVLVVLASAVFTPNAGDEALRQMGVVGAGGLTAQKARLATMAALGSTSSRAEAVEFLDQYVLAYDAGERRTTT